MFYSNGNADQYRAHAFYEFSILPSGANARTFLNEHERRNSKSANKKNFDLHSEAALADIKHGY